MLPPDLLIQFPHCHSTLAMVISDIHIRVSCLPHSLCAIFQYFLHPHSHKSTASSDIWHVSRYSWLLNNFVLGDPNVSVRLLGLHSVERIPLPQCADPVTNPSSLGPFYGAIAVPSVTRCRCCLCRCGHPFYIAIHQVSLLSHAACAIAIAGFGSSW